MDNLGTWTGCVSSLAHSVNSWPLPLNFPHNAIRLPPASSHTRWCISSIPPTAAVDRTLSTLPRRLPLTACLARMKRRSALAIRTRPMYTFAHRLANSSNPLLLRTSLHLDLRPTVDATAARPGRDSGPTVPLEFYHKTRRFTLKSLPFPRVELDRDLPSMSGGAVSPATLWLTGLWHSITLDNTIDVQSPFLV